MIVFHNMISCFQMLPKADYKMQDADIGKKENR